MFDEFIDFFWPMSRFPWFYFCRRLPATRKPAISFAESLVIPLSWGQLNNIFVGFTYEPMNIITFTWRNIWGQNCERQKMTKLNRTSFPINVMFLYNFPISYYTAILCLLPISHSKPLWHTFCKVILNWHNLSSYMPETYTFIQKKKKNLIDMFYV